MRTSGIIVVYITSELQNVTLYRPAGY